MGAVVRIAEEIYVEHCCACGMPFGLSKNFEERRRKDGKDFYCPSGHPQHYTDSPEKKLQRQLAQAREEAARAKARAARAEFSRRAEKAAKTRMKNRIANGVCPCCKRHFENVERHMKSKHPEFVKPEGEA